MSLMLLFTTAVSPAAVTIDDFEFGDLTLESAGTIDQSGLDSSSVISGRRSINASALGLAPMNLRVDTIQSLFSFSSSNWGYFEISYLIDPEHQVDLMADGSNAFRFSFSYVDPGFWRGSYNLSVDGESFSIAGGLFSTNGPGTIEVPFSAFTDADSFTPSEIVFSASRVEPNLRLDLSSITTVPEPGAPMILMVGGCFAMTCVRKRAK